MVVVCLAFLLVKGFSFALPNINPSSYALQISLKNLTCADGEDYHVVKDCTPCSSYDMVTLIFRYPALNSDHYCYLLISFVLLIKPL